MILTQTLQRVVVKAPLQGNDKKTVISELLDLLAEKGLLLGRNFVLDKILMQEETRSTGIGSGIAIPHIKCNYAKELLMAIGITKNPIDFASMDGKGVYIVILLVSPIHQISLHIQTLAGIIRMMLDERFKQQLEKVASAGEVYEILKSRKDGCF
jgi:mannitol/fructose-specific phosphotransferase system IIA component (Ntr-type)